MDVQLAAERVLRMMPQISFDEARTLVEEKKVNQVAGTVGAFFTRPKPEEITLTYSECRYEPFWRITANTHMVYERNRTFTVTAGGPEVKQITIYKHNVEAQPQPKGAPTISFSGTEHCEEKERVCRFYTGDGVAKADLEKYLQYEKEELADLATFTWDGTCVPPATKSGAIIRQVMTEMVRPIKAQMIHTENIHFEEVDLCFRPVYAFEFHWAAKNKRVTVECDGITRDLHNGGKTLKSQFKKLMDRDLLFDISADALGTIIPGASIAVKLTHAAIKVKKE